MQAVPVLMADHPVRTQSPLVQTGHVVLYVRSPAHRRAVWTVTLHSVQALRTICLL